MTVYKFSNPLFSSARLVTTNFPVDINKLTEFVNFCDTSGGKWKHTSTISDFCSDLVTVEELEQRLT